MGKISKIIGGLGALGRTIVYGIGTFAVFYAGINLYYFTRDFNLQEKLSAENNSALCQKIDHAEYFSGPMDKAGNTNAAISLLESQVGFLETNSISPPYKFPAFFGTINTISTGNYGLTLGGLETIGDAKAFFGWNSETQDYKSVNFLEGLALFSSYTDKGENFDVNVPDISIFKISGSADCIPIGEPSMIPPSVMIFGYDDFESGDIEEIRSIRLYGTIENVSGANIIIKLDDKAYEELKARYGRNKVYLPGAAVMENSRLIGIITALGCESDDVCRTYWATSIDSLRTFAPAYYEKLAGGIEVLNAPTSTPLPNNGLLAEFYQILSVNAGVPFSISETPYHVRAMPINETNFEKISEASVGQYYVRFTGTIDVPMDNTSICVDSDDGFALNIDRESNSATYVIDWRQRIIMGSENAMCGQSLRGGRHTIELLHYQLGGGAGLKLYFFDGTTKTEVPFTSLHPQ